jgi:nucleotide-binding universal stress UspA family protein
MPRSILVCLDGNAEHSALVELGIRWAKQFDCLLVGVTVVDEPRLRGPSHGPPGGYLEKLQDEWVARARHEVEEVLERFTLRCTEAGVACKLLEDAGTPGEQILREAQRYDLVLMGRHACYQEQKERHDTLSGVLRSTPRPVVVVPDQVLPTTGGVLIAYDGSVPAAKALYAFASTGLAELGDVRILSVDATDSVAAARTADRARDFLASRSIPSQMRPVVRTDSAAAAILDEVFSGGTQLVVMGAYGKPTWHEFFLGSSTSRLVAESPVPVFLYH